MQLQCKYTLRYHFKAIMIQVSRQKRCTSKPGKGRIINTDTTRFINLLSIDKNVTKIQIRIYCRHEIGGIEIAAGHKNIKHENINFKCFALRTKVLWIRFLIYLMWIIAISP